MWNTVTEPNRKTHKRAATVGRCTVHVHAVDFHKSVTAALYISPILLPSLRKPATEGANATGGQQSPEEGDRGQSHSLCMPLFHYFSFCPPLERGAGIKWLMSKILCSLFLCQPLMFLNRQQRQQIHTRMDAFVRFVHPTS